MKNIGPCRSSRGFLLLRQEMTKIQLTRHLNKQIIKFSKQAHKSEGEWKCHTHGEYNYTKTEVLSIFLILIS